MSRWTFILLAILAFLILLDSFLGGFILPVPFEITFFLSIFITWIISPFMLFKVKNGMRIYFLNLIASLLVCTGFFFIAAPLKNDPYDWKSNLAGIEMMLISMIIWIFWGWIIFVYAGIKRFK
ncbi:MAG: hypothetical protein JNJ99_11765 [Crocinitomicaceae bacterium]|nr:hypothetical protein [Crocinitomicaceae bacterium]